MARDLLPPAIRARLDALDPQRRQNLLKGAIVGALALLMIGLYYATGQDAKKPPPPAEAASVIELGDARLEDDIRAQVSKEREEQDAQNKAQNADLKAQRETIARQEAQLRAMQEVLGAMNAGPNLSAPPAPVTAATGDPADPLTWENGVPPPQAHPAGTYVPPPGAPAAAGYQAQGGAATPVPQPQPPPEPQFVGGIGSEKGAPREGPAGQGANAGDKATGSKKKNRRFYLPPSFMPAKLLTGLAAKTVDGAKSDPEPMILRVQAPAVLPNEVRAQLQGCLVVGHGFGSLASERVEAQLVSISCLDLEGTSMIDSELHGILVDRDGVKGLAGHPVSKMGTNLARLAFAGAVQGAGSLFEQQASTTSVSPLGRTQTIDPGQIGKAGVARGVGEAAEEYGRIIAELVRQQSPVIEVGPSKDVTVVVTEGTWLELKSYEDLPQ